MSEQAWQDIAKLIDREIDQHIEVLKRAPILVDVRDGSHQLAMSREYVKHAVDLLRESLHAHLRPLPPVVGHAGDK